MMQAHVGMFTTVDALPDPGVFIDLLDRIQNAPVVREARMEAVEALALRAGERVLDLGCGTGDHTREIAPLVVPGGQVVGVDFSHAMVAEARRRQAERETPVAFEQGDAQRLRFEDGVFDAGRTERMLCHLPDARAALAEMVRVLRPGGRIAVIDGDLAGLMIDHPDRPITEAFAASMAETIQNPWIGRQLRRLLGEVGVVDVDVRPRVVDVGYGMIEPMIETHGAWMVEQGLVDADAMDRWRRELEYANLAGTFFMGMTMFVAVGRKP